MLAHSSLSFPALKVLGLTCYPVKKLKIESAMAKAALKKAQRAVDQADSPGAELEAALLAAKEKAKAAEKALFELSK